MSLTAEARLQGILESTQAGTWEWNLNTGEFICSERWASMLGYTLDELQPLSKKTLVSFCHPEDQALAESLRWLYALLSCRAQ